MTAKEFRAIAREKLKGNWGVAVLTGFVASLLGGVTVTSSSFNTGVNIDTDDIEKIFNGNFNVNGEPMSYDQIMQYLQTSDFLRIFLPIVLAIAGIAMVWGIATFILGGPTRLGYCGFNIRLLKGEGEFKDLFSYFNGYFLKAFLTRLLVGVITTIGYILLIVPGILATYGLSMTYYIMAENPEIDPFEAVKASWNMMKGYKWKLFCLQISFIGWIILCAFTLGIGTLFLTPYMEAATAAFYKSISAPKTELIESYEPATPAPIE